MNWLDCLGALMGVLDTLLLIRCSIWAWPVGIISIGFNTLLYWQTLLFADMSLQCVYFLLYCYGWWHWHKKLNYKKDSQSVTIHQITSMQAYNFTGIAIIAIIIIAYLLSHYTSSTTPVFDASTTVIALIAQWLTCQRIIQNWFLWLFNDSLYCVLYSIKLLPFHVAEHGFYVILAFIGYKAWNKHLHNDQPLEKVYAQPN